MAVIATPTIPLYSAVFDDADRGWGPVPTPTGGGGPIAYAWAG